jgi:hypothetical protein
MPKAPRRLPEPIEQLAEVHGLILPLPDALPSSYTLRMWLTRQLATAAGRHKEVWQRIREYPIRLKHNRELNRLRVQRWRERHRNKAAGTAAVCVQITT